MTKRDFVLLAKMITAKTGINCEPSEDGNWSIHLGKSTIYYPKDINFDEVDFGSLLHEISHFKFSDFDSKFQEKLKTLSLKCGDKNFEQVFNLINALEDTRIESELCKVYKGANYYFEIACSQSFLKQLETIDFHKICYPEKVAMAKKDRWYWYSLFCAFLKQIPEAENMAILEAIELDKDPEILTAIETITPIFSQIVKLKSTTELVKWVADNLLECYLPLCTEGDKKKDEMKKMLEKKAKNNFLALFF